MVRDLRFHSHARSFTSLFLSLSLFPALPAHICSDKVAAAASFKLNRHLRGGGESERLASESSYPHESGTDKIFQANLSVFGRRQLAMMWQMPVRDGNEYRERRESRTFPLPLPPCIHTCSQWMMANVESCSSSSGSNSSPATSPSPFFFRSFPVFRRTKCAPLPLSSALLVFHDRFLCLSVPLVCRSACGSWSLLLLLLSLPLLLLSPALASHSHSHSSSHSLTHSLEYVMQASR